MNSHLKFFPRGALAFSLMLAAAFPVALRADVKLPRVFSDHMVLQRNKPIQVWGWAAPGEMVTIQLGDAKVSATANDKGEWKAAIPAQNAGGPVKMTVSGSNTVTFDDVLVGEVWVCSGQSNMEMGISMCDGADQDIAAAGNPSIRLLPVPNRWTPQPQNDIDAGWLVCTPETVKAGGWGGFSACAYFFGHKLEAELKVPIGLIDSTWGGTVVQSWTPPEGFASVPALKQEYNSVLLGDPGTTEHASKLNGFLKEMDQWLGSARESMNQHAVVSAMPAFPDELRPPGQLQAATALFNGMIHPLVPYTIAGAIWYQGESNLGDGVKYGNRMMALINGWRKIWNEGDFPFYYVQIAPFNYGGRPDSLPELWLGQAEALALPNTGMAVINDIGNLKDIHPRDKKAVGERLARIALARTYGMAKIEDSGPSFKSIKVRDGSLRVTFDHAGGLASRDGKPLSWFEVIDADKGGFVPADAKIDGDSVILTSAEAPHPVAARFAWSMLAEPNLMNAAGLPASSFRAGDVPNRDALEMNVPEAKDYQVVYDLDLNHLGRDIKYAIDNSGSISKPFDRVAYFLEMQPRDGQAQYIYVSMKAFTSDLKKIGVPTPSSGARFQQIISDFDVWSNVKGIPTGKSMSNGNIEFWPNNYAQENSAKVPNASSQAYDFGDAFIDPVDGYGSMQVHDYGHKIVLFALNHWSDGENADLGIGNNPNGNPDWTFSKSASSYSTKRLRVLVRCQ